MANIVKGELYELIDGKLHEIKRQIRQKGGYAHNPVLLDRALQAIVDGEFVRLPGTPVRLWREENGVIYFWVMSDGTTGLQWDARLENEGVQISDSAKNVLRRADFKPTSGVLTSIAVLKGELFSDGDRIPRKICGEADKRKLQKPSAEVACLVREKFSDKDLEAMGLWWIVAMHDPIRDFDGDPCFLYASRAAG